MKTPMTLITGSLGSGKTTLLRRILETTNRRLAVLMNEFGEISIDSQVIQGENVQIIELVGGCVCCSLTGEFEAAVTEIIDTIQPEHMVVETTGVAEADALVFEVEDSLPQVRLAGVIGIVDAYASIRYPQVGYTTRTQLQVADIVLINKIDLVTSEQLEEVEAQVRKYNDTATIFRTVRGEGDTTLLLGLNVEQHATPQDHEGHGEFQSFTFASDRLLNQEKFEQVIADLPSSVFRAKGFVRFAEGTSLFNYVAGRSDLEEFEADKTQLVFIGRDLDESQDTILSRLRSCEI
jgi:G3E family GTPase